MICLQDKTMKFFFVKKYLALSILMFGMSLSPFFAHAQTLPNLPIIPAKSVDTTSPVVTLTGAAAMQTSEGQTFTDPGATAGDVVDSDLTAKIAVTGAVDTATAGLYTLTYSATDAAGNTGSVSRVVTVAAPPAI